VGGCPFKPVKGVQIHLGIPNDIKELHHFKCDPFYFRAFFFKKLIRNPYLILIHGLNIW